MSKCRDRVWCWCERRGEGLCSFGFEKATAAGGACCPVACSLEKSATAKISAEIGDKGVCCPRKATHKPCAQRRAAGAGSVGYDFDREIDRAASDSVKWGRYRDRDVLPMWVADMDFAAPPAVLAGLQRRVAHGVFGYALPTESVVEAVRAWLRERHGWEIEASWLVWLPGLVSGLNAACRGFAGPGEEVATFVPAYPPFLAAPGNTGRKLITAALGRDGEGRWELDLEALDGAVSAQTKVMILANPHNPVGRAYSRAELRAVVDFCRRRGLVLVSDEIHGDLILDDVRHVPTATLGADAAAVTITLMAPSKTFNVPGLNCGYAVIPDADLRGRFEKALRGMVPHPNALGYAACEAAYREGRPWLEALLEYLRGNRDLLEQFIGEEIPRLSVSHVEATYLAWIDARGLEEASPGRFFEAAGVGLWEGADFGAPGWVRLNFGCPRRLLREALERMKKAVGG